MKSMILLIAVARNIGYSLWVAMMRLTCGCYKQQELWHEDDAVETDDAIRGNGCISFMSPTFQISIHLLLN